MLQGRERAAAVRVRATRPQPVREPNPSRVGRVLAAHARVPRPCREPSLRELERLALAADWFLGDD